MANIYPASSSSPKAGQWYKEAKFVKYSLPTLIAEACQRDLKALEHMVQSDRHFHRQIQTRRQLTVVMYKRSACHQKKITPEQEMFQWDATSNEEIFLNYCRFIVDEKEKKLSLKS
jgi:hypothetical protein